MEANRLIDFKDGNDAYERRGAASKSRQFFNFFKQLSTYKVIQNAREREQLDRGKAGDGDGDSIKDRNYSIY